MTTLLILRHGFTYTNQEHILAGHTNSPLTEHGKAQGKLACQYIYDNYKVDAIYSSDLIRAETTVSTLSELTGLPINKRKELREMHCGVWENVKISILQEKYGEQLKRWSANDDTATPENGESWSEVQKRAVSALEEIAKFNDGKTVVIATHGAVIKTLMRHFLKLNGCDSANIPYAPNASLTVAKYDGNDFTFECIIDEYLGALKTEMPKGI